MKGQRMDIDWRTVQFFIGDNGVAEVLVDAEDHRKVKCTCESFSRSAKCAHSLKVRMRMRENEGHYRIQIPEEIEDDVVVSAMSSPESFREFLIKYGKVEVL
jgi:hypothetical protein